MIMGKHLYAFAHLYVSVCVRTNFLNLAIMRRQTYCSQFFVVARFLKLFVWSAAADTHTYMHCVYTLYSFMSLFVSSFD